MTKFKVGDKVRIKDNLKTIDNFAGGYIYELEECVGDIDTIRFINGNEIHLEGNDWSWDERALELVSSSNIKCANITVTKPTILINKDLVCIPTNNGLEFRSVCDESIIKKINKGELNMENKVLELWYEREKNKLTKEYEKKERSFFEENSLVKEYKKLVNDFEDAITKLYESVENQEQKSIAQISETGMYRYEIDYSKLVNDFRNEYELEYKDKMMELDEKYKNVYAMLSLSEDLEYQLDVLRQYGIVDKKTRRMVD